MPEKQFFTIFSWSEFNPNPIIICDKGGDALYLNEAANRLDFLHSGNGHTVPKIWKEKLGEGNSKFKERVFEFLHESKEYKVKLIKSAGYYCFICCDMSDEIFAHQVIKAAEFRYKLLAEYSDECLICHDSLGRIKFASPEVYFQLGYNPKEFLDTDIRLFTTEKESRKLIHKEVLASENRDGQVYLYLQLKNSEQRYFEYRYTKIKVSDTEEEFLVELKDISDQKSIDHSKTEEWKFQILMNVTADGILFHKNGVVYDANRSVEALLGYSKNELKGMPLIDITNVAYKKLVLHHIIYNKETSIEILLNRKDGQKAIVEMTFKYEMIGKQNVSIVIVKDLKEKQEFLEKLDETEKKYEFLVESTQEFVYTADYQGNFTYLNPGGIKKMGYSKKEILGLHFTYLIRDDWKQKVLDFYQNQFQTRTANTYFEFPVITRNGEEFWVGQSVHALFKDRRVIGYHSYARDITERIAAEEQLLKAKMKLEESVALKEKFISVMSHEIRTPMNAVIGITNLLLQSSTQPEQLAYLKSLKSSSNNLLSILNSVLDQSRLDAGKIQLEQIEFSIRDVLNETIDIFKFPAFEKKIELKHSIDEKIPFLLLGDSHRLSQILVNLLSNAIKFTELGFVLLKVEMEEDRKEECLIEFLVEDTGIGISSKYMNTIFESFTQADTYIYKKYGGSGLGLSITKGLVELLGGRIQVESSEGKGTVFSVKLPFKKTMNTRRDKLNESGLQLSFNDTKKVLVVEDNEMNQLITTKFLEKKDIKCVVAENGVRAIELIKSESDIGLILMDLQMPEMDGYETARYIRNELNWKDIPIIAFSASSSSEVEHAILDAGMNDYIVKPFEPDNFYKVLFKYLKK